MGLIALFAWVSGVDAARLGYEDGDEGFRRGLAIG